MYGVPTEYREERCTVCGKRMHLNYEKDTPEGWRQYFDRLTCSDECRTAANKSIMGRTCNV